MTRDERFMRAALAQAKKGFPAPNPHVGCVIVQGDEIVGRGYCKYAGAPHAEAMALTDAGDRARGAEAFVTLEPCNSFGRTPPCSDALLRAQVNRVVYAVADPNPKMMGGGAKLAQAGVSVEAGLLAAEATEVNWQFLAAMARRRVMVTVKAGASLDGRIALPSGESQWITGPAARRLGHRLRAECGVVLVGRRTVEADDPELTARIPGVVNQPLRVVLDPGNKLSGRERVFNERAETRHVTGPIDLHELVAELFEAGHVGLLVEGGGATIGGFFRVGLVDRLELFLAPKLLGDGPGWVQGLNLPGLEVAPQLEKVRMSRVGPDLRMSALVSRAP